MQTLHYRPLCAMLILIWSGSLGAAELEEEELALAYGDKTTISLATGSQQTLRRAPAVATVITAADIAAMGATELDEVLETVPGIHVSRAASLYSPIYVIRGSYSQVGPQTLLLQNGIPMTTTFTGNKGNIWGGLGIEHIARIEIIRGPGSALYGADAYSGVINIITKGASDLQGTEFGLRGGSFDSWDGWVQHGGRLGPLDLAAFVRLGRSDGQHETVAADAQTRNDTLLGTRASLAPGPVSTGRDAIDAGVDLAMSHWRLRLGYKLRDEVGAGAGAASALDPVGRGKSQRINTDLSWINPQLSQHWGAGITLATLHYKELFTPTLQLFPPGTRFPTGTFPVGMLGSPNRWERQLRLSGYATYNGLANHSLRVGLGHDDLNLYRTSELKNFSFSPSGVPVPTGQLLDFSHTAPYVLPHRRKLDYVYIQDEWRLGKDWTVTGGVRRDHYSDFGNTTNPRFAVVWDAAYDLTVKLLYGRAFRAPAFNEQHSINNPVTRGNPNLRPETIKTTELAFSWQPRKELMLNLNFFHYDMEDIIRLIPNPVPGTGSTYFNIGRQSGRGAEFDFGWDISRDLRLVANYAYQRSTDKATHRDAGHAPHHELYGRLDWRISQGWQFSGQLTHIADRKRVAGDLRPATADYTSADFTVRSERGKGKWDVVASLRNAFDEAIREPSVAPGLIPQDLPMAGRSWYLQLRYQL
ncbi:TonB-dependent receptor plug domain-containing protein [Chitinimonas lacunae]|uniref:TonB-dependent receptor plug domain-containing protein n=1 Tax=Chitinimonas lacunae TaxID=1963018 RepID=A0ABV8MPV5_9NEIS